MRVWTVKLPKLGTAHTISCSHYHNLLLLQAELNYAEVSHVEVHHGVMTCSTMPLWCNTIDMVGFLQVAAPSKCLLMPAGLRHLAYYLDSWWMKGSWHQPLATQPTGCNRLGGQSTAASRYSGRGLGWGWLARRREADLSGPFSPCTHCKPV